MQAFLYLSLILYAIGSLTSLSLMAAASTFLVIYILIFIIQNRKTLRIQSRPTKIAIAMLFLYVCIAIVHVLAVSTGFSKVHSLRHLPLMLLPLLCVPYFVPFDFSKKKWDWLIYLSALSSMATFLMSLVQFFQGLPNPAGFYKNSIYFAYAALPAFLFFCEALIKVNKHRLILWLAALAIATAIILSNNRMTSLLVVLYLIFRLLPFMWRSLSKKFVLLAGLFLSSALGTYLYQKPVLIKRFQKFIDGKDSSWRGREIIWQYNLKIFSEKPLLGSGHELNYMDTADHPEYQKNWKPGRRIFAHSIYLQNLADSGLIGFTLFFGFFLILFFYRPELRIFLGFAFTSGLSENIFNNAKAFLPLFFFMILLGLYFRANEATKRPSF